jgi:hypothetical protein
MKAPIIFHKKKEVRELAKFLAQLVREGVTFDVKYDEHFFFVMLTGGF